MKNSRYNLFYTPGIRRSDLDTVDITMIMVTSALFLILLFLCIIIFLICIIRRKKKQKKDVKNKTEYVDIDKQNSPKEETNTTGQEVHESYGSVHMDIPETQQAFTVTMIS